MATGFFTAASGMLMQQRYLNVIGNNLANVSTPGFKTERVVSNVFVWELLNRIEHGQDNLIGDTDGNGKRVDGAPVRLVHDVPTGFDDPSSLKESTRPYDLAINGLGFFNIKLSPKPTTAAGGDADTTETAEVDETLYFTRNGNFDLDNEGYLILRGAGRVQGKNGDILLGGPDFTVREDGVIFDKEGEEIDTLLITVAKPNTVLVKGPNGLYTPEREPVATPASMTGLVTFDAGDEAGVEELENVSIYQRFLEGSNVDLNREMSLLMEVQRNYESARKILQITDEMDAKAVTLCQV